MTEQQPIAVLGGGSFGTAIANLLAENGQAVRQWMRDPEQAEAIRTRRENPRYLKGVKVHPGVEPVTDLERTLADCQLIFVALPSSALRKVLQPHQAALTDKLLVSLTKGIEAHTFKLMSEILEEIAPQARIGVISGPNLAREIAEHELTATVVASEPCTVMVIPKEQFLGLMQNNPRIAHSLIEGMARRIDLLNREVTQLRLRRSA